MSAALDAHLIAEPCARMGEDFGAFAVVFTEDTPERLAALSPAVS